MEPSGSEQKALSHLRICDFTGVLAGAGATRILAAFGAQVIRVEDRVTEGRWDILRGNAPFPEGKQGLEMGGAFNNHNVEKLGITLNMRSPKGKELLRKLIGICDVLTENFSAGVVARWGFPYEEMAKINPSIIYVSNSGFGHTGPYSKFKTWGPTVQAVSGLTFLSGLADMPPAGWGYSYMDHSGAYFMCLAILMALYHRDMTGQGQWVDLGCTEAAIPLCGPSLLDYTVNGRRARRPGQPHSNRNDSPAMAPHGIYRCMSEDRWVAIAVRNERDWQAFCDVLGHCEWLDDPCLATLDARMANQDELDFVIEAWTSERDPYEIMEALQQRGIPAAAVQTPEERIEYDPNTQAWGLYLEVEHPEMGRVRVDGIPAKFSATPAHIRRGAPLLGQHNDYVYGDLLGLSAAKISALREEGVI